MTNRQLLFLAGILNVMIMFLTVHKQNIIIKKLYELQQLQETKNQHLETKKERMLKLHQLTQLSKIQDHAQANLGMRYMTQKDAHVLNDQPLKSKESDATIE